MVPVPDHYNCMFPPTVFKHKCFPAIDSWDHPGIMMKFRSNTSHWKAVRITGITEPPLFAPPWAPTELLAVLLQQKHTHLQSCLDSFLAAISVRKTFCIYISKSIFSSNSLIEIYIRSWICFFHTSLILWRLLFLTYSISQTVFLVLWAHDSTPSALIPSGENWSRRGCRSQSGHRGCKNHQWSDTRGWRCWRGAGKQEHGELTMCLLIPCTGVAAANLIPEKLSVAFP